MKLNRHAGTEATKQERFASVVTNVALAHSSRNKCAATLEWTHVIRRSLSHEAEQPRGEPLLRSVEFFFKLCSEQNNLWRPGYPNHGHMKGKFYFWTVFQAPIIHFNYYCSCIINFSTSSVERRETGSKKPLIFSCCVVQLYDSRSVNIVVLL